MRLHDAYGDQLRRVVRDFPLPNHAHAFKAAEAAHCAADQDRFWDFYDIMFANQRALEVGDLRRYARQLGLDPQAFNACLDSGGKRALVEQGLEGGQAVGVSATPTFFINGRILTGAQPFEAFQEIIEEELARGR